MNSDRSRRVSVVRRRVATGAALAVLMVAASAVVADPALADVTNTMVNSGDNLCLDSNDNGDVYMLACNGGSYQKWRFAPTGGSFEFLIINAKTNRCLDSNGDGRVYTLWCNGGNFQKWQADGLGDYYVRSWKNTATGRYLRSAGSGGKVDTGEFQVWDQHEVWAGNVVDR